MLITDIVFVAILTICALAFLLVLLDNRTQRDKLRQLELENWNLKAELTRTKNDNEYLDKQLREMSKIVDPTPPECKRGAYCNSCVFSAHFYSPTAGDLVVCGKGGICPRYTNVEEEEDT